MFVRVFSFVTRDSQSQEVDVEAFLLIITVFNLEAFGFMDTFLGYRVFLQ